MYQMAMTLLERNRQGDLDYKSISKLYELESRFDEEYAAIMQLFKESNVVYKTATNYYFHKRDENGVWRRICLLYTSGIAFNHRKISRTICNLRTYELCPALKPTVSRCETVGSAV